MEGLEAFLFHQNSRPARFSCIVAFGSLVFHCYLLTKVNKYEPSKIESLVFPRLVTGDLLTLVTDTFYMTRVTWTMSVFPW